MFFAFLAAVAAPYATVGNWQVFKGEGRCAITSQASSGTTYGFRASIAFPNQMVMFATNPSWNSLVVGERREITLSLNGEKGKGRIEVVQMGATKAFVMPAPREAINKLFAESMTVGMIYKDQSLGYVHLHGDGQVAFQELGRCLGAPFDPFAH